MRGPAARDSRERDDERVAPPRTPPPVNTETALLRLQRVAGNSTVAAMLREPRDRRRGRPDPDAGRPDRTEGPHPGAASLQRQAGEDPTHTVAQPAPHRMLRWGSRGADVADAQARLNRAGARPPLVEDGIFGPKTHAATVTFQRAHLLAPDGVIGPLTRAALDAGDVVPPEPDGLECGCDADDEGADVLEVMPEAVEVEGPEASPVPDLPLGLLGGALAAAAAQREATVQRDATTTRKKKRRAATAVPAKCRDDARACFSISSRRAWLLKPGKVVERQVPALGGRKGHPTPVGRFTVIDKDANHHSSKYKDPRTGKPAPMPNYVNFAPQVGFHAGSLAVESHGCVHLSPAGAKAFFDSLNKGDKVDVVP